MQKTVPTLGVCYAAQMRSPTGVCLSLAIVAVAAALFGSLHRSAPASRPLSVESACVTARSYAAKQLADNAFSEVAMDDCGSMSLSEQTDDSWIATGLAQARQFGAARASVAWTARVAAFASGDLRVCAFGISAFSNDSHPRALDVPGCDASF
jgi:hypothetical protein